MPRTLSLILTLIVAAPSFADEESFLPLFDGQTLNGWTTLDGQPITKGWVVEEGCLHRAERGASHIISEQEFLDFDLRFDWKVAEGGNSGVKYKLVSHQRTLWGLEYQLLDDERHSNAKNPLTSAGAIYQLYAPITDKPLNPAEEWNSSRIVVRGSHVEHWLNGTKILDAEIGSEDWTARIGKSKYRSVPDFAPDRATKILLQDHGNPVWFRDIRIQSLERP